jgi:hypothetical protein
MKRGGRQQTFFWVLPADQGFQTHHDSLAHIHLRLVMQAEFAGFQPFFDLLQDGAVLAGAAIKTGIEPLIAVAAALFGRVHGLIHMPQQGVGINAIIGIQRDPKTGVQRHRLTDNHLRGLQRHPDPIQRVFTFLNIAQIAQQQHKFIAAQPGNGVAGANAPF